MKPLYRTQRGVLYHGASEDILEAKWFKPLPEIITRQAPFALASNKHYTMAIA